MAERKAYSYLRFSTAEQSVGDSFRRQTALAHEYAVRHGLKLDTELTFRDLGISSYRGKNARKGALGAFLKAVDDEIVDEGSFLLVESLDRVTRQDPWKALPLFQQIINAGITIVTLQDGKSYSRAEMRGNHIRILESLFVMIRANEESATKARRLRAVWANKRRQAGERVMTARMPAWLTLDASRTIQVVEDRAGVVRRIFDLLAQGNGQGQVAATLNAEGVAPFDDGKRCKAEFWHRSYIRKIAANPAVIGTLVPHEVEYEGGRRTRRAQEPIANYYPAVVNEVVFQQVQAMRMGAGTPRVRSAQGEVQNLLAGLAICIHCGSTMTRVNKGPKGGHPRLACVKAKVGRCDMPSVRLDAIEQAIVGRAEQLADLLPDMPGQSLMAECRSSMALRALLHGILASSGS